MFVKNFSIGKNQAKFNELNEELLCFALRTKKRRPRKKGKGKDHELARDSSSLSAILKRSLTCFSSHNAICALRDFRKNSSFTADIESKWKTTRGGDDVLGIG